ncbi:MAG: hypothetical protein JNM07_10500 [Phycisphaerae bacterium]|nr:hypothetical protein [Phycisphaerae bacterium]
MSLRWRTQKLWTLDAVDAPPARSDARAPGAGRVVPAEHVAESKAADFGTLEIDLASMWVKFADAVRHAYAGETPDCNLVVAWVHPDGGEFGIRPLRVGARTGSDARSRTIGRCGVRLHSDLIDRMYHNLRSLEDAATFNPAYEGLMRRCIDALRSAAGSPRASFALDRVRRAWQADFVVQEHADGGRREPLGR